MCVFPLGMEGQDKLPAEARNFYRDSLRLLSEHDVPFLVGGAYAMAVYTGIRRETKDFDLFVRLHDLDRVLALFAKAGYEIERTFPHWLAKIFSGDHVIDLIYRAGNGLCEVDDSWLERAEELKVIDVAARITAPEELIWMKAYIMERERYDGADVAHLLFSCADRIDWKHLLARFGADWRVLLAHLVLFDFIYPTERHLIPAAVVEELCSKFQTEQMLPFRERVCRGTLLSRAQYLIDVQHRGFRDARLDASCQMTSADVKLWTDNIPPESKATIGQTD